MEVEKTPNHFINPQLFDEKKKRRGRDFVKVAAGKRLYFSDRGRKGPFIRSIYQISLGKPSRSERKPLVPDSMTEQLDSSSSVPTDGSRENMEQDGSEGDDERTSGQSGGEAGDRESLAEKKDAQQSESCVPVTTSTRSVADWKPLPVRKKHRRGSRRNQNRPGKRYVPYSKLSWEEKKQRDERDTKRAFKLREQINAKGRPTAPYNTTQFLMAEHDLAEPDLGSHAHMQSDGEETPLRSRVPSNSCDDSDFDDDYNESPEDEIYEQQFFEKDFTEAYEQVHVENLHSMSKSELVREFMLLEERVENMEIKLKESEAIGSVFARRISVEELSGVLNGESSLDLNKADSQTREEILLIELTRLRKENERLLAENEDIKKRCQKSVSPKVS